MAKAVLVTKENVRYLENQYAAELEEYEEYIGYFLVADFGATNPTYGFLSKENLEKDWLTITKIDNEYSHVVRK